MKKEINFPMIDISTSSMVPFHTQLYNQLRHLILSGQWEPGRRLPSELELQKELGISRSTIRQALKTIENEGLIVRVTGKGSYVRSFSFEKNKSRIIGYVTPEFSNDFQYQLFRGAESAAGVKGYRLLFCCSNKQLQEENKLLKELVEDRVSGILIYPAVGPNKRRELHHIAHQSMVPVIQMDRKVEDLSFDFVSADNYQGAYDAVCYLIELGHRNIELITSSITSIFPIFERIRGYRQAMKDNGLVPKEPFVVGQPNKEMWWDFATDGFRNVYKAELEQIVGLFKSDSRPTAVFTVNQVMAILTIKAAQIAGLSIPADISVMSFDETKYSIDTPLTSICQYSYSIGKRASELLIERIEGFDGAQRIELIPSQLQIRSSTGKPKG